MLSRSVWLAVLFSSICLLFTVTLANSSDYQFGAGSFQTEFWIANKLVFSKPVGVDVEFITAGPFDWVIADPNGNEVRTLRDENPNGGWTSIDFPSLGLFGDYSIGFRNASAGEQQIKQGEVRLP